MPEEELEVDIEAAAYVARFKRGEKEVFYFGRSSYRLPYSSDDPPGRGTGA
jgi:hypothetical protein